MIDIVATFIVFFAVIDPIGTVPVFLAVTPQYDPQVKRRIALLATLISAVILLFFMFAGELILKAMSVPLEAFQISGGIMLFLFALNMIFGESKPEEEVKLVDDDHKETAIYPLAVPSIAGPGAMLASVLMTENSKYDAWEQVQTAAVMLVVLALACTLMLASNWIDRVIGRVGASVVSRVMGLILSAVAVSNVLAGFKAYFQVA